MKTFYHATDIENLHNIMQDGLLGSTCGDIDDLKKESGFSEIVFLSSDKEKLITEIENCYFEKPSLVLEVEVESPFFVNSRMMLENEYIAAVGDTFVVAAYDINGVEIDLDSL